MDELDFRFKKLSSKINDDKKNFNFIPNESKKYKENLESLN